MLPTGPSPRLPLAYGRHSLTVPGHAPRALPAPLEAVTALARLRSGWLIASRTGGDGETSAMSTQGFTPVTRLDRRLDPVWTRLGAGQFAVSGSGASAYFATPGRPERPGRLTLVTAGGAPLRTWHIPFGQVALPVGISSHRSVVYNLTSARGDPRGAWTTGPIGHRTSPRRLPLYRATAARGELIAGQLRNGCQVVLQARAPLWRRCDGFRLAPFSPDRRYLAAWHTETGGEFESAYILDARTGHRVTDTTVGAPTTFHGMPSGAMAWEDSRHLLMAFDDSRSGDWEVLRLGLDGRLARTSGAVRDAHTDSGFVFVTTP